MDTIMQEQERFEELAKATSESLAYFYCCIAFDVPFDLNAVPGIGDGLERWSAYRDNLRIKGLDRENGKQLGFLDGLTDITAIFGERLSSGEFSRAVSQERSAREAKAGTEKQRKVWGPGDAKKPYTNDDYKRLDELYNTYGSRLNSAGGPDSQQEYILRLVARMSLDLEKALAAGATDKAQKLNKMIQENLASENLRKKDARPVDDVRIDGITDRLEKAGLLKNGKQCDPDEMFRILFGRAPKYAYTKDAAEQIILINENRMRNNDSMPELATLPDDMRLTDGLGEFAEEPNEQEKEAYEKLGLVRMPRKKDGA